MRINTNANAINVQRNLNSVNSSLSKSIEKLSSGLRINRAGDDAAGLYVSEKLRGQDALRKAPQMLAFVDCLRSTLKRR